MLSYSLVFIGSSKAMAQGYGKIMRLKNIRNIWTFMFYPNCRLFFTPAYFYILIRYFTVRISKWTVSLRFSNKMF